MGKFDVNPFDRSALTDYKLLAGRADEFKQIRFILRNASKQKNRFRNILISGDRGVGKTSFLNLIEAECESNFLIPIRLNLTESNTKNSNEFFWLLFSQTIAKLFSLGLLEGKGGAIDLAIQRILNEDTLPDPANWVFSTPIQHKNYRLHNVSCFEFDKLVDDVERIRDLLLKSDDDRFNENTKLLYLVDEAHHLYSKEGIVQEIRFVVQHPEIGIGFVFAGDNSYHNNIWEKVFGGSYRDFELIKLDYFKDADDVISFFRKSLTSIEWTDQEIDETLFYKFHRTCLNIFQLTSGKPEWINIIASKMFDRLMKGEVNKLKFDKDTQNEVKLILENSGKLDRIKINYISNLPQKKKKWLSKIFACQLSYLEQVHRFSKFLLNDENFLDIEEFRNFCKDLIEQNILILLETEEEKHVMGYTPNRTEVDILKSAYYTFGTKNDSIKHWLQINSDGFYKFRFMDPSKLFLLEINDHLASENNINSIVLGADYNEIIDNPLRLSVIIKKINDNTLEIGDLSFEFVQNIYKICKRVNISSDRFSLFGMLKDHISERLMAFNGYNYDDKGRLVGYHNSNIAKEKYVKSVESFNSDSVRLSLELYIDKLDKPDIDNLQNKILLSEDKRKLGIIKDDKMEDLIDYYVKKSDKKSSLAIAQFFYKLFEEGHDLDIRELNNAGYVFIEEKEYNNAYEMLNEGKRKVDLDFVGRDEFVAEERGTACLLLYNLAILEFLNEHNEKALKGFEKILKYIEEKNVTDFSAGVLKILELQDESRIIVKEIKEGDTTYSTLNVKVFTENNFKVLQGFLT